MGAYTCFKIEFKILGIMMKVRTSRRNDLTSTFVSF